MPTTMRGLLLLLAGAALLVAATAYAQEGQSAPHEGPTGAGRPGPPSPAMELHRLAEAMAAASLPLTAAQQTTILGVFEDRDTAMEALHKGSSSRTETEQQAHTLLASTRAAVRAALTPAQAAVFDAMQPPARPNGTRAAGPGGEAGRNGAPPPVDRQQPPPADEKAPTDESSLIDANTGGAPATASAR